MGVYACLQISLLLILQTVWISSLSSNASNNSFQYGSSLNSLPLQHQVLGVTPLHGGEKNGTVASYRTVSRAKGGKAGSAGAGSNNHRPGKSNKKNAASSLFKSNYFAANSAGLFLFLVVLIFFISF